MKPILFLNGFTLWLCQFCTDWSFSFFFPPIKLFSELFKVVLVKVKLKVFAFNFKKDKDSLGWCWEPELRELRQDPGRGRLGSIVVTSTEAHAASAPASYGGNDGILGAQAGMRSLSEPYIVTG